MDDLLITFSGSERQIRFSDVEDGDTLRFSIVSYYLRGAQHVSYTREISLKDLFGLLVGDAAASAKAIADDALFQGNNRLHDELVRDKQRLR